MPDGLAEKLKSLFKNAIPFAVMLAAVIGFQSYRMNKAAIPTGKTLPKVALADLDGNRYAASDWGTKIRVVTVWATWCGTCRAEIPQLREVAKALENKGETFLALSVDDMSDMMLKQKSAQLDIDYPVVRISRQISGQIGAELLPTTIVLSRDGTVADSFVGVASAERILDAANEVD